MAIWTYNMNSQECGGVWELEIKNTIARSHLPLPAAAAIARRMKNSPIQI